MKIEISVVIPAYNEERDITATVQDVHQYCRERFRSYEIIVVDDGSSDRTASAASAVPDTTVVRYQPNRGKGHAVKTGVLTSRGELVLFMDADNSTNIRELEHFIPELEGHDIVIGSRALADSKITVHQNPIKRKLGRLGNVVIRMFLGLPFRDTQCGYKLFRRSAIDIFQKQRLERWGFDFEVLFLAHKKGYRIYESAVTWTNNFDSKVTAASYLAVLIELVKIRWWYLLGKY